MTDPTVKIESIQYQRVFPWLNLLRAFWIAVDIRKLMLAALALVMISAGDWVARPFAPRSVAESEADDLQWPWKQSLGYDRETLDRQFNSGLSEAALTQQAVWNWPVVLRPLSILIEPAASLFRPTPSWSRIAYDVTRLLWALIVWAIVGGALGRMAALQFARDQRIGVWPALKFSFLRFFDYVSAPLLPLVGVLMLWGLCAAGGAIGRIPMVGETIVGLMWGLALILGFLMGLVLVGVAAGWPLMFATVSVEATDGFDGLSRAYNYVFERPLLYLGYGFVALVYGSIVTLVVWLAGQLMLYLGCWAVASGLGYDATAALLRDAPRVLDGPATMAFQSSSAAADPVQHALVGFWLRVVAALIAGFVYSYFWTVTTIMYFLLRRSVDANDFDEIYVDEADDPDDLLPLVGSAATTLPLVEHPVGATNGPTTSAPPVDLTP